MRSRNWPPASFSTRSRAAPLIAVVEANRADEFVRCSALDALAYLVCARGVIDDQTTLALPHKLYRVAKPDDGLFFRTTWADVAAILGYEPLRSDLVKLNDDGRLDKQEYRLADRRRAQEETRKSFRSLQLQRDAGEPLQKRWGDAGK